MPAKFSFLLSRITYPDWAAKGCPNHFSRAAGPTFVKAGIFDQDGQVISTPVVPGLRARRTARNIVPADLSYASDVFQNAEFGSPIPVLSSHWSASRQTWRQFRPQRFFADYELPQLVFSHFPQAVQKFDLGL